jgi:hypothetical protein
LHLVTAKWLLVTKFVASLRQAINLLNAKQRALTKDARLSFTHNKSIEA